MTGRCSKQRASECAARATDCETQEGVHPMEGPSAITPPRGYFGSRRHRFLLTANRLSERYRAGRKVRSSNQPAPESFFPDLAISKGIFLSIGAMRTVRKSARTCSSQTELPIQHKPTGARRRKALPASRNENSLWVRPEVPRKYFSRVLPPPAQQIEQWADRAFPTSHR